MAMNADEIKPLFTTVGDKRYPRINKTSKAKPARIEVETQHIPRELAELPRWVCWRWELRDGKWTKPPINPWTRGEAKTNDDTTWSTYSEAMASCSLNKELAGVGFVFVATDDLMGVDVDGCLNPDGSLSATGETAVKHFGDSYCEVSPSGSGLKFIIRATIPGGKSGRKNPKLDVEAYGTGRYFTITGRRWLGSSSAVLEKQPALDQWFESVFPARETRDKKDNKPAQPVSATAHQIIEKASAARNGEKFRRLWAGDCSEFGDDQSSADLGLCSLLAFWCGPNPDLIDEVFQASGLMRPKWERDDYRSGTIKRAVDGCREFYDWNRHPEEMSVDDFPPAVRGIVNAVELLLDERTVNDAVIALLATCGDLYDSNGQLATIVVRVDDLGEHRGEVHVLSLSGLREIISQRVQFFIWKEDKDTGDERPAWQRIPRWTYEAILSRGAWPGIRPLRGIVTSPVLRADGSILQTSGYDEASGLYVDLSEEFPNITDAPSTEDVQRAVAMLFELVRDFPFADHASRSAWLASLLTPLAREAYRGCTGPLFLFDANTRGSGKSLLADINALVVTGREATRLTSPKDDEECRKRVTALVTNSDRIVLVDNIAGRFGCAAIDAALTGTVWKDRRLGHTELIEAPLRMTWYGSGNNVLLAADTARRVCHIRLESPLENPEDRSGFQHADIRKHVRQNRPALLAAALTVLRGYIVAGRPDQKLKPWGSFEGWSDLVRQSIVWSGQADPGETRTELRETADTESGALRQMLEMVVLIDGESLGLRTSDIIKIAQGRDASYASDDVDLVRDAVESFCGGSIVKASTQRLGNQLSHFRHRVVGQMSFDFTKRSSGRYWFVSQSVTPVTPVTPLSANLSVCFSSEETSSDVTDMEHAHNMHTGSGEKRCHQVSQVSLEPLNPNLDWLEGSHL